MSDPRSIWPYGLVQGSVSNNGSQPTAFLVSLWLFTVFSSPTYATWLGAVYIGLRALYPIFLGKRVSKAQSKRVAFVTFPSYVIIFAMLGGAAWSAWTA